ncbi:hypothetical protein [Vibrio sp. WXL103]|uniref:hypothetical protein n=1 Tax=Vibrio sp. WXL103 TaxID=3450710 RepID=UPI003EC79EFB
MENNMRVFCAITAIVLSFYCQAFDYDELVEAGKTRILTAEEIDFLFATEAHDDYRRFVGDGLNRVTGYTHYNCNEKDPSVKRYNESTTSASNTYPHSPSDILRTTQPDLFRLSLTDEHRRHKFAYAASNLDSSSTASLTTKYRLTASWRDSHNFGVMSDVPKLWLESQTEAGKINVHQACGDAQVGSVAYGRMSIILINVLSDLHSYQERKVVLNEVSSAIYGDDIQAVEALSKYDDAYNIELQVFSLDKLLPVGTLSAMDVFLYINNRGHQDDDYVPVALREFSYAHTGYDLLDSNEAIETRDKWQSYMRTSYYRQCAEDDGSLTRLCEQTEQMYFKMVEDYCGNATMRDMCVAPEHSACELDEGVSCDALGYIELEGV